MRSAPSSLSRNPAKRLPPSSATPLGGAVPGLEIALVEQPVPSLDDRRDVRLQPPAEIDQAVFGVKLGKTFSRPGIGEHAVQVDQLQDLPLVFQPLHADG